MNFFEAQDNARRKTWQLALLFAAAVVSLIVLTNLLVAVVYIWTGSQLTTTYSTEVSEQITRLPMETWLLISSGVVGLVGVAGLYKYLALRGGGRAIAEMLGGSLLTHQAGDLNARRLLNVVEEMAIASGVPVPPVYLIPEQSINAFAAGFSPDDAVIGVNQGTIDHLSRDELQGVMAHEFSHVLNGDMRLNLRLIAILHGIIFLSMIGATILRGTRFSSSRRSNGSAPVLALGVGLLVIGWAGNFFGNLIKAAVSRQREYLADAAAVQFTRNPDGIADALKKIGGLHSGSTISAATAGQASHMFFGQINHLFLNGLMATHPPLGERIQAIQPAWDGEFIHVDTAATGPASTAAVASPLASGFAGEPAWSADSVPVQVAPEAFMEEVGQLDVNGLSVAHSLLETTDQSLQEAAHDPWGSRALIYAMLIDEDATYRAQQLELIDKSAEAGVPAYVGTLLPLLTNLGAPRKLTLIDMAMPALKSLSRPQYQRFVDNTISLIKHDQQIDLFEWVLHRLLLKELKPHFEGPARIRARYKSVASVAEHAQVLLSTLARIGHRGTALSGEQTALSDEKTALSGEQTASKAFNTGAQVLQLDLEFVADDDPNFSALNRALRELRRLKPLSKPQLLKACAATAMSDDTLTGAEAALLRGVAAALDCPLPPSIYQLTTRSHDPHQ